MARRAFLTRLAQVAALPLFAVTGSLQAQAPRKLKILMKSVGLRRSYEGRVSLFARAGARRSRTRSADLFARRGGGADA